MSENKFQAKFIIKSMKSKIADQLLTRLADIPQIKSVSFDSVKLLASDFKEHEIPAIQLIDKVETIAHEMSRVKKTWELQLEVVLKGNEYDQISQQDLWNLVYEIERKLWEQPNLGIAGVVHARYLSNETDLHLLAPFYFAKLNFEIIYYQHLVSDC